MFESFKHSFISGSVIVGLVFGGEVVGGFNKTLPAKPFLTGPNKSEKNLEYLQNGKFSR